METWKPVTGFEGLYEVSDQGRFRRVYPRKYLTSYRRKDRYCQVGLSSKGKCYRLYSHRVVAAAFLGPCPDGKEVCHNNGDRSDNRLVNLRYGTREENVADRKIHKAIWEADACLG